MNDIVNNNDLKTEIITRLLDGESEQSILEDLQCGKFMVNSVISSDIFATNAAEIVQKRLNSAALRSVVILSQIMDNEEIGANPRIRAAEILLSKSLEIQQTQGGSDIEPSTMTQPQLIKYFTDLQKEVMSRAKPVDTGIIDMDDMLS